MKKFLFALFSALVLLNLSPVALAAASFSDVPKSHWAYKYIEQMAAEGILTGYADGTFRPDTPMKRSEFSAALAKISNLSLTGENSSYSDVNDHWSKQYVVAVSPYIDGISDTTFEPDTLITREATVSALVKIKGYDTSVVHTNPEGIHDFDDVSPAFQTYVAYALTHNMVNGYSDNTFRPKNSLTRAEASTMLYKAFHYEIDTVASNLTAFRSMVMDNENNLYYINGSTIFSTKLDMTLDIETDFSGSKDASYLAYDPYHDVVYLITDGGWNPSVYDITDFTSPSLVINKEICPALNGGDCAQLAYSSYIKPQIGVLTDGTLLIPFEARNSTWLVNLEKKTVTEAIRIYSLTYQKYSKVVNDEIMQFEDNSNMCKIYSEIGFGANAPAEIKLEMKAPENKINSLHSKYDSVYFYLDSVGVCYFTTDGSVHTLIPQEYITIKDHLSLDATNIWGISVGDQDHIAFYDNSQNCIRLIRNAQ